MARTTRSGRGRVRGSFGQWTTGDSAGPVQEYHGWDATRIAVVDGGGCLLGLAPDDPDGDDAAQTTTRRPRGNRKGGRR